MPQAVILVPGYGAQGGTAADAVASFKDDGLGALVNASRSLTYAFGSTGVDEAAFRRSVKEATSRMIEDVTSLLAARQARS
jgi:orotidine-5'-phosphate decarboxylase